MSVLDAVVLGRCLAKSGAENLQSALREYQSIQLPVVSKQVLHARKMGCIKQGLVLPDCDPFDPKNARLEDYQGLQQKNLSFFDDVPSLLLCTCVSIIMCYFLYRSEDTALSDIIMSMRKKYVIYSKITIISMFFFFLGISNGRA